MKKSGFGFLGVFSISIESIKSYCSCCSIKVSSFPFHADEEGIHVGTGI